MFGFDMPFWLLSALGFGKKIVSGLFTFFTTVPGVYLGLALLLAGSGWWLHHAGYNAGARDAQQKEQMLDAQARQQAIAGALIKQKAVDAGLIAAADHAGFLRGQAQARTITITKEIPKYVTVETDKSYPVPCGLVRLHDAAALGADPADLDNPAGLADGETCPVKDSDLAAIIVWNYGVTHEDEAQIAGLQDALRALANAAGDKVILNGAAQ